MNPTEQITPVLEQLERCHTAMADFFPHAGLLEIGGSKSLLGSRLMPVIRECATSVCQSLSRLPETSPEVLSAKLQLSELWSSVLGLLERLDKADSKFGASEVNEAARLLYLTSGTTWHYLCGLTPDEPLHNPQYVKIEPMLPLLKRCGREANLTAETNPKQLVDLLHAQINACLR